MNKVFIIAGEVSGDVLGSSIVKSYLKKNPKAQIIGVGGENMIKAGMKPIFNMKDIAVMGLVEVLKNLKQINKRMKETIQSILDFNPDVLITIDSGGFNKRVVKAVKKAGFSGKCYHVVAPAVWAWGPKRAKSFAETFDKLYCFFDFEIPYFTKYGLNTMAVGHPILESGIQEANPENFIKKYNIKKSDKVIMILPGSRKTEVKSIMSEYKKLVSVLSKKYTNIKIVIPVVETMKNVIQDEIKDWKIKPIIVNTLMGRYDAMSRTDLAIAVSGTVSVELAILQVPAIIVYRFNRLSYLIARLLIKLKWVSLVNIIRNKSIYPELIQNKAKTENILPWIDKLLSDSKAIKSMKNELKNSDKIWHKNKNASDLITDDILIKSK